MAIAHRGSAGKGYVYRSFRDGDRTGKVYIGAATDPVAQIVHRVCRLGKAIRSSENEKRAAEIEIAKRCEPYMEVIAQVAAKWRFLDRLFATHPRWGTGGVPDHVLSAPYIWAGDAHECLTGVKRILRYRKMSPAEINQIVRQAAANDPAALERLTELIADQKELFAGAVDLMAIARDFVVDALAGDDPGSRAAVAAQVDYILSEFDRDNATDGLERMLIDIAAVAYLDAMKCSALCVRATDTQKQAAYWSSAATRSDKRAQAAIAALEQYRTRLRRRQGK